MTDREKQIIESIATAIPRMSEFEKGYFLGAAEAMAEREVRNYPDHNKKAG